MGVLWLVVLACLVGVGVLVLPDDAGPIERAIRKSAPEGVVRWLDRGEVVTAKGLAYYASRGTVTKRWIVLGLGVALGSLVTLVVVLAIGGL